MAYVDPEKKAKIAAALMAVVPPDWKYSLAVRDHRTLVMTISEAPVDFFAKQRRAAGKHSAAYAARAEDATRAGHMPVYLPDWANFFEGLDPKVGDTLEKIRAALNIDNPDEPDTVTNDSKVGHYVQFEIGRWDKAFVFTSPRPQQRRPEAASASGEDGPSPPAESLWVATRAYFGLDESFLYNAHQIGEYVELYRAARRSPAQIEPVTWAEVVAELGLTQSDPRHYTQAAIRAHTILAQEHFDDRDWEAAKQEFGLDDSFQYSPADIQDYLRQFRAGDPGAAPSGSEAPCG